MRTSLKTFAVGTIRTNFYPPQTIERFKKLCRCGCKIPWLKKIQTSATLSTYIDCLDTQFYGPHDDYAKMQKKLFLVNDITPRTLNCFSLLNRVLLEDTIEQTEDEMLLKYYRLILSLNDGTAVLHRDKVYSLIHRTEAKIINRYAQQQEPCKSELRQFIIISALFANHELHHSEQTRSEFKQLCLFFK